MMGPPLAFLFTAVVPSLDLTLVNPKVATIHHGVRPVDGDMTK
jgi:hypothetical protein